MYVYNYTILIRIHLYISTSMHFLHVGYNNKTLFLYGLMLGSIPYSYVGTTLV